MTDQLKQKYLTQNSNKGQGLTREDLRAIADAGKKDFWFFCKHILGQSQGLQDITERPHKWMCQIGQNWNKRKKLILTPRDSFKTTILSVCYCVWEIVRDPNITIFLTAYKANHSKDSLAAIKEIFESHEFFRACYGNYVPGTEDEGKKKWSETAIIVSKRTSTGDRAPTIATGGVETGAVGSHYKIIIFDDPHFEKNITSSDQIGKVIQYYRGLLPIMDAKVGRLVIIATRWHQTDIHNHIFSTEPENFDIYIKKAFWEEDGKIVYFFPDRLDKEYLEQKKKELGTYFFSCQFQNDPVNDELTYFKNKDIRNFIVDNNGYIVYTKNKDDTEYFKTPKNDLKFFVCIDPAGRSDGKTDQRKLDYTAAIVCGVDFEKNWFIFEAFRQKGLRPSQIIEMIFKLHNKYKPEIIGIEETTWQGQLKEGVLRAAKESGNFPRIRELEPRGRNKNTQRIMGLQPLYEAGFVFHNKGLYDLEDELLRWTITGVVRDDIIDAEAYLNDLIYPPDKSEVETKKYPELHESPGLLIDAHHAWKKSGDGFGFKEFIELYDPEDFEELALMGDE